MAGIGTAPKIKIKGTKQDIDLGNFHFENIRYIEDINAGFPELEIGLKDNLFTLLRGGLFGDEELIIEEFISDKFSFTNKSFRIKSIGALGVQPRPAAAQTVKLIAIDKNYDAILKNQKSVYFTTSEKKKPSDLLKKLLTQVGIKEQTNFSINIADTAPLKEYGFQNMFIPYSADPMKVIRKLCNYSMSPDGTGAFTFYINRRGLYFVPLSKLFVRTTTTTPYLQITDFLENYGINSIKLSTFNSFSNFVTGNEKKILGFNLLEKDYNYIWYKPNAKYTEHSQYADKAEQTSNVKSMPLFQRSSSSIPFSKDFMTGNVKTYYTPLDSPQQLKAFGDSLYYGQMLSYTLEVDIDFTQIMPDFAIGEIVNIDFFTSDADRWVELSGPWLLKSLSYTYPGDNCLLKLVRIGSSSLPEQYVRIGE